MTRLAFAKRTHTAVSTISEVIMGKRKPPMRRLATWITVLDLNEDERQEWRQAAIIANAKPEVRELIYDLQARIDALTATVSKSGTRRVAESNDR